MDINAIVAEAIKNEQTACEQPAVSLGNLQAGYDANYAQYMDHTVLKPETTKATLKKFCDEAKEYQFASVCINPVNVPYVYAQLKGTDVKTCAVVGFPLGANTSATKAAETAEAVTNGASEIDMVINIGALKDKDYEVVYNDIFAVVKASHPRAIVKVIIECSALTDEEKIAVCAIAKYAGADFVKTSSGFGAGGATVEDVRLMKRVVGEHILVKASTGINDRAVCDAMLQAGAVRMGTSKGIRIVKGEIDA